MGSKSRYEYLKSRHICTQCGKYPAESGITLCLTCKMDKRERDKIYWEQRREKKRTDYFKKRREKLLHAGICSICGKRKSDTGRTTCLYCRAKARIRETNNRRKKGVVPREIFWDGAHCAICGTENITPGRKSCEKCYPYLRANMLYARACRTGQANYFERFQKLHYIQSNRR